MMQPINKLHFKSSVTGHSEIKKTQKHCLFCGDNELTAAGMDHEHWQIANNSFIY